MAYTVKKISALSGVSIRTLHFYEEAELLRPAYYGSNGYRYYEERELLRLQQILFYKELGFTLKQIRKVLGQGDFDQLAALYSHKLALRRDWERKGKLMETVDRTIQHLKGQMKMKKEELFRGFHITLVKRAKESAPYFDAEEIVVKSVREPTRSAADVEKRGQGHYEKLTSQSHALFKELSRCIEKGLDPACPEVQKIIRKHHALADQIHFAQGKVYKAMALLYREHPEFRKQLEPFHPQLPPFMAQAMEAFAEKAF